MKMTDIRIKEVKGIEFDQIIGFTADLITTTLVYMLDGKQRTLSIESDAVEIEIDEVNK